jgi:hypothetical protein
MTDREIVNDFGEEDENNVQAPYGFTENERDEDIDANALAIDSLFVNELRDLKREMYTAVVFGPPVDSEEAQSLQMLETYESLLLELNNLLASIFEETPSTFTSAQFARFPAPAQAPARAYCLKILEFKNTNTKPYLNDVLQDMFDRSLKEHPY